MLGDELRKARQAAGLSQEKAAARARITREYLSQIENDRTSPTVRTFLRLCRAVNVSGAEILGRVEKGRK